MRGLIVVLVLLLIAALVVFVPPIVDVTYYESEPYTTTETYVEQEPFTRSVPIEYRVTEAKWYNWFWSAGADVWVTIRNADTKSGYFYVEFNLVTTGGATATMTGVDYIALGEERQIMVKHDGDRLSSFTYEITPPVKDVTEYRDVTKTRQVIRYRDVAKTKKVSIFEYLTEWM